MKRAVAVNQTPAVVVGAGINGLGVLRSLSAAKIPVVVIDVDRERPAMRSRYGRKCCYQDDGPLALVRALEELASGFQGRRAVLFLTEEEAVATIACHQASLERFYHLNLPPQKVLERLLHKEGVRSVAASAGIAAPKTLRIRGPEDVAGIDAMRPPLVIKPGRRDAQYARFFRKAYRVDSAADARSILERILPVFSDVMIQEWIAGSDSDIYFCLQYLPASHAEPVSFVGRKIRSWPPRVGGTASCTAAPEAAELAIATTAFFRHAGVTGMASMEYKRDTASGEYLVVEPTVGRTDYQQEVATLNGINLPLVAYCDTLGLKLPLQRAATPARIWRDRVSDIRSAESTPSEETRIPVGGRVADAVWRLNDPMPALIPLSRRAGRRLISFGRGLTTRRKKVQP